MNARGCALPGVSLGHRVTSDEVATDADVLIVLTMAEHERRRGAVLQRNAVEFRFTA